MKTIKLTAIIAIAGLCFAFTNNDTPFQKLLKQLAKITESYPQEKVHLHTDKPYYAIGEEIWFKGYVVNALNNEPSFLSAVLYVDLANDKNVIFKRLTLPVVKGMAHGNIGLTDSLSGGTYRLRAYTNYMRNYDEDFFFEKLVTIGNTVGPISDPKKTVEDEKDFDLSFFPEGGALVAGLRSKVGVKAVAKNGSGKNLSGYIVNEGTDEKVALFETEHAGMGAFAFTPVAGTKYSAVVRFIDGKTKSFKLPEPLKSGYVLGVNQIGDQIKVSIAASADLVGAGNVNIIAQANGKVAASFTAPVNKALIAANIPKKNLPTGIVQVTMLREDNTPIAERLIFVNHDDALGIDIKELTGPALTKKKTSLEFTVKDLQGQPIDGNFSVSVTDAAKVPSNENDEITILSNLLLSSDIKGYIEAPNYYFNHPNEDKARHLDQLLLTQGWRRFLWTDIAAGKEPDITFRPELSLEITGKVTTLGSKPLPGAKITLISATPGFTFYLDTISDIKGNFVFDLLDIPDSVRFIVQAKTSKDRKNAIVTVDQRPGFKTSKVAGSSVDIRTYLERTREQFKAMSTLDMQHSGIQIQAVNINLKRPMSDGMKVKNSTNAAGGADFVMGKDRLEYETSVEMALRKAPGVRFENGMPYSTRGRRSFMTANIPMLLIIDGMMIDPAAGPSMLAMLNPRDLEGIEVLTSGYNLSVYGAEGSGGVVHITTKSGNGGTRLLSSNIAKTSNRGFSPIKEFYAPNYDDPRVNKLQQDLRTTIFWKPEVITDTKGKATVHYFNAGSPGKYRVIIEGIDAFGNIGRKVYTYDVK